MSSESANNALKPAASIASTIERRPVIEESCMMVAREFVRLTMAELTPGKDRMVVSNEDAEEAVERPKIFSCTVEEVLV